MSFVDINISWKMLKLKFKECEPNYILNHCKGSCCQSSVNKSGTLITIHKSEEEDLIKNFNVNINNGILESVNKKCPFKNVKINKVL